MDASAPEVKPLSATKDTKDEREKLKKEAEKLFVKELRLRVDDYFRIAIKTLRVFEPLFRKSSPRISVTSWSENLRRKCSILFTTSSSRTTN